MRRAIRGQARLGGRRARHARVLAGRGNGGSARARRGSCSSTRVEEMPNRWAGGGGGFGAELDLVLAVYPDALERRHLPPRSDEDGGRSEEGATAWREGSSCHVDPRAARPVEEHWRQAHGWPFVISLFAAAAPPLAASAGRLAARARLSGGTTAARSDAYLSNIGTALVIYAKHVY